jgi:hypothetical protein
MEEIKALKMMLEGKAPMVPMAIQSGAQQAPTTQIVERVVYRNS